MSKGLTKFITELYEETSTGYFEEALDNITAEDIAKMAIADGVGEDVVYFINEILKEGNDE